MTSHRGLDANSSDSHRRGAAPPLISLGRRVIDPPVFPHPKQRDVFPHCAVCSICALYVLRCRGRGGLFVDPMEPTRLLCPWDSSGKNTGVRCHLLRQRIFPTQGSNLGLTFPVVLGRFFTTSATWESLPVLKSWPRHFLTV